MKTELVYHERYEGHQDTLRSIFEYIEVFYNRQRRHSTLEYLCPAEYEKQNLKLCVMDVSDSFSGEQLQSEGCHIGRYRVRRLMRELGLEARKPRRYKVTTDSRHSFPVAPNILNRQFEVAEPNRVWTADITYVWTLAGWLYLAVVMDLFSRQIVGWAMDKRMKKQLVMDALSMAFWRRKPAPGLLHHSDRGSQYACKDYQKLLSSWHMVPSMSRKGNCWEREACPWGITPPRSVFSAA